MGADVAPAASGSWASSGAAYRFLVGRGGSPSTSVPFTPPVTAVTGTAAERRLVSHPLVGPGTLSGTVKAYALARAPTGTVLTRLELYVVSEDGATVRGSLLAPGHYGSGTALLTVGRARAWALAGTALTPVAYVDGDRLVAVFGYAAASGTVVTTYGDLLWLEPEVADAAESESATSGTAWLELSQTVDFWQVSVTDLYHGNSPGVSAGTQFDTAAVAFPASTTMLLWSGSFGGLAAAPNSVTSLSNAVAWSQVLSAGPSNSKLSLWRATVPVSAPANSAVRVQYPASQQEVAVVVLALASADAVAPIVQTASASSAYPITASLPGAAPGNAVFAATFGATNTTGGGHVPEVGWGQRKSPVSRSGIQLFTAWSPVGDDTPQVLAGGDSVFSTLVAVEVKSARPDVQCVRGTIVVDQVSPTPGTQLGPFDPVSFHVRDTVTAFRRILPVVAYPNLGWAELVHDGDAFLPAFAGSERALASAPGSPEEWAYALRRAVAWPDRLIRLTPYAFSTVGSESPPYTPPGPTPGLCPAPGVVTVIVQGPTPGSTISARDRLRFTVADSLWAFRRTLPALDFPGLRRRELVHDGDAFLPVYAGSTRVLASAPGAPEVWAFDVGRAADWPDTTVTLVPYAFDVAGGAS